MLKQVAKLPKTNNYEFDEMIFNAKYGVLASPVSKQMVCRVSR